MNSSVLPAIGTAVLIAAGVAGCATYRPLPLAVQPALASSIEELQGTPPPPGGLTMDGVDRLVLEHSPELVSLRAQQHIAHAQMLEAGVLPNPSVNLGVGYLLSGAGDSTAWSAGIGQDVAALITLAPMREAARATEAQINASLLWQEWQTVAKAQLLVVDISEGERLYAVQGRSLDWLDERAARLNHAIAAGDEERGAAAPALAAAADARTAHDDLQRTLQARHRELTALLGLRYDAVVSLAPLPPVVPSDDRVVRTQLATLAQRRPDLVALRLGYAAQEATLRAAVLAQFPALTLGYSASQDNSRVRNGGPAVTFDLPVFNHNQHAIAMASATRQQLHDEFAARIADAHDEVESLLAAQHTVLAQKARSDASPGTTDASSRAAFDAGLMDVRIYVDLVSASASRQAASITLEQTLREQIIALETLTGAGMPASLPPAGEHHE